MKPIIRWTLWQRRWSTLWWVSAIVALVAVVLAFYPPFRDQASQIDKTITQQIPQAARAFISDTQGILTPVGYLSSQIYYLVLPMILSILAIGLGSSLIAGEEQAGTIELLLSRPLSRSRLLAGKAVAGVVIVTAAALASLVTALVIVPLVKLPVGTPELIMTTLACLLLALAYGAIALLVTMYSSSRGASIGVAAAVAVGGYIISSLATVATWLKWPARFTPFHYYHPADMLNGRYSGTDLGILMAIIVVCGVVSVLVFRKRDIS